ncbi:calcium-independent phospholipase A2-gamma [Dunckerocampus dactyliophorus]|uniref:calcium-independent phospholipase A2-gamma n=1 Tax=Dunckerocampus dactyliophorus TaxID=161453 RepID=UPI002406F257|nr:calcium-independent phospholipase A2-gamma [Dunckerocampus dactyliophorus]XP_054609240.1 calcium-independent phospholipase A2-gamma [Dunckerocampus dactyliophorus]
MSRIRSTLDNVTKAVGSTDLISKFSRLKPGTPAVDGTHAEKLMSKTETSKDPNVSPPLETSIEEEHRAEDRVTEKPFVAAKTSSSASEASKQTMQLFHPAGLSTNMDETYKTLAQHINSYFGMVEEGGSRLQQQSETNTQKPAEHVPVLSPVAASNNTESPPPTSSTAPAVPNSTKKGFTHYLSYPRPSVQAFVGNYIAPLVPKFRGDTKSIEKPAASVEEVKTDSEDEKADKAKQKQLLAQREKIIARVSVDNRTRALMKGLQRVADIRLLTSRVEELSFHLLEFPETRGVAIKEKALPCLLRLRQATDQRLQAAVREALALIGYTDPVKGRGIRVLAIDGGGTRGLLALQTLLKLQNLTGKRVHQLFDYICGVSTGAILAFMLGIFQIPLEECEQMYRKLGSDVFKQNVIVGAVKMGWSHAFYDSEIWEHILKERMGEGRMIESARDPNCPKVSAVSTIVNRGLPLKAYVFRNYRLMPGVRSHYPGDCKYKMWQAIRASSAAPGYFQEFVLGKDLHQDGGLLINNPTALAIHECKSLWPNTPLQCVLSLGTGRHETVGKNGTAYTSLKTKLTNVISSATDTEEVHTMLDALLPPDTYFRFNPHLSEDVPLNESRVDKLNFLMGEGERYLQRNDAKLQKAASVLAQEKGGIQKLAEWAKLKADMYDGRPFSSKL